MSKRIQKIFQNKNKKLLTFTTGGDPDLKTSIKVIEIILDNGADIIEIGMPFSDPMADGPTIQLSSKRAIAKGKAKGTCVRQGDAAGTGGEGEREAGDGDAADGGGGTAG